MLQHFLDILVTVILPVLAVAGLGAAAQRLRPMNVQTLTHLNIYVFVPAFLFKHISESTLSYAAIGGIGAAVLLPMVIIGLPLYALLRWRGAQGPTLAALIVGGLFFNAANFGIPVAELAFPGRGGQVEALVVVFLNTTTFLLGYAILSLGQGHGLRSAWGYFKLPMIYVLVAGFLVRDFHIVLPRWLGSAINTVAAGMVPLALITLGSQLASRARWPRWRLTAATLFVKLLVQPAVTAAVVFALGLWPWPGAQLILASAGPTAVNILLLTLELGGDSDLAADTIFWTTLGSTVTVTLVLTILQAYTTAPM